MIVHSFQLSGSTRKPTQCKKVENDPSVKLSPTPTALARNYVQYRDHHAPALTTCMHQTVIVLTGTASMRQCSQTNTRIASHTVDQFGTFTRSLLDNCCQCLCSSVC